MNFIDDRELARRFREGAVYSRERLLYFVVLVVSIAVVSSPSLTSLLLESVNEWDTYIDAVTAGASVLGVLYCYRQNRRGDDREFIERSICIGFPVAVQMFLLMLPLWIVLPVTEESSEWDLALISVGTLYYYARLGGSIKIAAT